MFDWFEGENEELQAGGVPIYIMPKRVRHITINYIHKNSYDIAVQEDGEDCYFSWVDGVICISHSRGKKYINGDIVETVELEYADE